jgi:hypothetical protein
MEPGAILLHEWRDSRNPYRVGPSIGINANGELTSGGKTLLQVPHSQWVRFQIECALGKEANGAFVLTVTLPGKDPQRFENLPCGASTFRTLDWLGFVSNATESTIFYLDDLKLDVRYRM